jgi:predicted restriction endonuclease
MKKATDKYLLKLWAEQVKERAEHRCEYPDCKVNYSQVHAHHIFSRRHASLRYDIKNGISLCPSHHTLGLFSAHKDPAFIMRLISCGVRSSEWFDELIKKRNIIIKNNQSYKNECLEKFVLYGGSL